MNRPTRLDDMADPIAAELGAKMGEMHKLAEQGLVLQADKHARPVIALVNKIRNNSGLPSLGMEEEKALYRHLVDGNKKIAQRARDARNAV